METKRIKKCRVTSCKRSFGVIISSCGAQIWRMQGRSRKFSKEKPEESTFRLWLCAKEAENYFMTRWAPRAYDWATQLSSSVNTQPAALNPSLQRKQFHIVMQIFVGKFKLNLFWHNSSAFPRPERRRQIRSTTKWHSMALEAGINRQNEPSTRSAQLFSRRGKYF